MSAAELVARLKRASIIIEAQDDRLKVSAPKGAITEIIRAEIGARKAELLELLNRPVDVPLRAVPRDGQLPVSQFQRRLWVLNQLRDDTGATHNLVVFWRIRETRDPETVIGAVRDLARRHELLRSIFLENDGEPYAALRGPEMTMVAREDISHLSVAQQRAHLEAAVNAEVLYPFDLAKEIPFRWRLYEHADGLTLMVTAHHIAIDQWSFALLREELRSSIGAQERHEELPAPAWQYFDFADWQRRSANGIEVVEALDWWADAMKGAPQLSLFPPDHTAPGRPQSRTIEFRWGEELAREVRSLAQRERATPYMVLLAACAAVLSLHTRQRDLVVGSSLGSRERQEFESMIGPFVDLLAMRFDLEDDPSLAELIARARDAVLDAHAHRSASFEMLVERLKPARSLDHAPLFQIIVTMHNATSGPIDPIHSGGALHHMTWYAREDAGELSMAIEYRSDRYDEATVRRIAGQLETVVRTMIANPACPVSKVTLLAESDRLRVLEDFNRTTREFDESPFIVQFERRAAEFPDRAALGWNGETLTLGTLDAQAGAVAALLAGRGIGRGDRVGICMSRTPSMVAALLAVQKLGAAYVPLDPDFPAERLSFMAADSGLRLVLADEAAATAAVAIKGVDVLDPSQAVESDSWPHRATSRPDDPAYVIYTSGSTGRPNGVVVQHRALSNFLASMASEPGLGERDVLAAVTTISFDIAGLELYLPLLTGAMMELVPRTTATDGAALVTLLRDCNATAMQATPATWRLLLAAGWNPPAGFKAICGGESLAPDLAAALRVRVDALWNLYGPTETTIWSTAGQVDAAAKTITVGRPVANTQVYIVDSDGEPVAPGIAGEILIGGAGVALGYHERPELTQARFVPDRFGGTVGGRVYRTGDVGRWTEGGEIVHMGRIDHQVKIRGHRIELQEIEEALARHPAMLQAVVLAIEIAPETTGLVAYCVLESGRDVSTSDARAHLRNLLPAYMIPSVFIMLDEIPLTPNGKVDRKALPDPFGAARLQQAALVPPAPGAEQTIAEIWQELLSIERVSAADNFFDLGGHSLLSLRMASMLRDRTGLRIQPRMLFTQSLAQVARAAVRDGDTPMAAQ